MTGQPEAMRGEVRQAARTSYQYLLPPGQARVLRQLREAGKGPEETRERWEAVRQWLKAPEDLAGWRVLALVLRRLHDPESAQDPVNALADFLAQTSFNVEVRGATLEVPYDV